MIVVPRRSWLALGLLLSVSACKGGGAAQALCELTLSCECRAPPYATVDACVADYTGLLDELRDDAANYGLTFSLGCFNTVLDLYSAAGCGGEGTGPFTSCSDRCALIHGDEPLGAVCNVFGEADQYSDCASDLYCGGGRCFDPCVPLSAGSACIDGDFSPLGICADGLYCDYFDSLTCKPVGDVDSPCTGFFDCKEGLQCSDEGKCAVPPGEGEACTTSCAAGFECGDADVCVASESLLCETLTER